MKKSQHTTAISIFGVALPSLAVVILLVATLYGRGKLQSDHNAKLATYEKHVEAKKQAMELDAYLTLEKIQ